MGSDELVTLLIRLVQQPDDEVGRRKVAEALEARGQHVDAIAVLAPFTNLTAHEAEPTLPCLCKTCFAAAPLTAEVQGVGFHQTFAVTGRRVLHFWLIDDLAAQRGEVRRSVGDALKTRLKRSRRRA